MSYIKNLSLLEGTLAPADLEKMEHAATSHKMFSNITFKIVDVQKKAVEIQVTQEKSAADNHATVKRLIEVVHETFDQFFPKMKIHVHPIPYTPAPVEVVSPEWITRQMTDGGIKLRQISKDTGIDYTQLSSLVSGARPLSQPMKAVFYYYFLSKTVKKH